MFQSDVRVRRDRGIAVNESFRKIPGSICAPRGFKAAAVFCDIKRLGTGKGSEKGQKRDLALIVSDVPAAVAGMFTANQVCAAPVKVSAKNARAKFARAIIVNSGNANACTGKRGLRDAEEMTRVTANAVGAVNDGGNREQKKQSAVTGRRYRITAREVLVGSTGRIGVPMPMANVNRGIRDAAQRLARSHAAARDAAEAIMTSDTRRKEVAIEFDLGGVPVRIGGICKGAGMIQPQMTPHATMLGFITTDAAVDPDYLKRALEYAVGQSFNRITVDGDMSTNDTVLVLANGLAGNQKIKLKDRTSSDFAAFQSGLTHVCLELARMIVRDGEGVSRFVTVRVTGAKSLPDADAAARAVANSALVKTSWHGGDPNWGRIIDAVGYSAATVVENKVDIGYSGPGASKILWSLKRGQPTRAGFRALCAVVAPKEFDLPIRLNLG